MKYYAYMYGASDDLVIIKTDGKTREDIAVSGVYELDVNGTTLRLSFALRWTIDLQYLHCFHEYSIIRAVDHNDDGTKHTHELVPEGCPGYSDCMILSSDNPFDTIFGWGSE
jgi:hypothetical protein